MNSGHEIGYGVYWRTWLALLALTVIMVFTDKAPLPRGVLVAILVAAMLMKASLIGAYFMHLRFENIGLIVAVMVGLFFFGAVLFLMIVPDGLEMFRQAEGLSR